MLVELIRIGEVTAGPQFGILRIDGVFTCLTLERPWQNNEKDVSCIPLGIYNCRRVKNRTTHGGMEIPVTYEVEVLGRTGILFHVGNSLKDTRGCILPGCGIAWNIPNGYPEILASRSGFERFLDKTKGIENFTFEVKTI